MKISKSPMLISSVLENALKRCFSAHGGNFRSKFLSCQAYMYQDAANHVFEKRKNYCFRNYEVFGF